MKNNPTLIAIVCGLLAALLFLSQIGLGVLGVLLSTFTAFPLFVSVLGFGTRAGLISGGIAAAAVAVFFGLPSALVILFLTLLPALWIGHMVGLSRDDTGTAEWFPVSSIVFRMAGMSAVITIVAGIVAGYSVSWAQEFISKLLTQYSEIQATANNGVALLTPDQISQNSLAMAKLIPIAFPASIFFLMTINLLMGMNFARKRGWILRPQDDLAASVALPYISVGILGIAVAASLLPAPLSLIANTIAGAFGAAFIAVGLATIHYLSRGFTGRGILLPLTYVALLFIPIIAPLIAVLGLTETLFQLRARFTARPPQPPHSIQQ